MMGLAHVPTHIGRRLSDEWDVFAPPPPSIGKVLSLQTNRPWDDEPGPVWKRLPAALTIGALAGFLSIVVSNILNSIGARIPLGYALGIGVIAAGMAFVLRRRTFELTFVGEQGLARLRLPEHGDREFPQREILLFDDVAELRTTVVHHYIKGGFAGAGYAFVWLDESRRERFSICGAHYEREGHPSDESSYHFGQAADAVWSKRIIEKFEPVLAKGGTVEFRVFADSVACVGMGFVEFRFGRRVERLTPAEVSVIKIDDGALHIETNSRKWYQGGRVCRISYDHISNAKAFLTLLQKYGGFYVQL